MTTNREVRMEKGPPHSCPENAGHTSRHAGTDILVLVHDLHIRVLNTTGELLRELQLDPTKHYQPQPKT